MQSKVYQADWLDHIESGIDFRRTRSHEITDSIVHRAQYLTGQDRALVLAMYRDGQSAANIARLSNQDSRQVRRQIRRALLRLTDPNFIFVIANQSSWSPTRQKIARDLFQSGLSIRQTAENLNLKVHQVRRHRTAILELINASPNRNWQHAP